MPSPDPRPDSDDAGPGSGLPAHVAIIMDGNGRWAKARNLPRSVGHERGVEALRRTVEAARDIGLTHLSVYSFSTENWRRPVAEVNALFGLLKLYVAQDLNKLKREGVRIRVLGTREGLPKDILDLVQKAQSETEHNTAFNLCIAFNYGGREEIARAAAKLAQEVKDGSRAPEDITEEAIDDCLDTAGLPEPDLMIRTSGEMRTSNFLIWQSAYAELLFLDVLWPDFGSAQLQEAIDIYQKRERRYGGLAASSG